MLYISIQLFEGICNGHAPAIGSAESPAGIGGGSKRLLGLGGPNTFATIFFALLNQPFNQPGYGLERATRKNTVKWLARVETSLLAKFPMDSKSASTFWLLMAVGLVRWNSAKSNSETESSSLEASESISGVCTISGALIDAGST